MNILVQYCVSFAPIYVSQVFSSALRDFIKIVNLMLQMAFLPWCTYIVRESYLHIYHAIQDRLKLRWTYRRIIIPFRHSTLCHVTSLVNVTAQTLYKKIINQQMSSVNETLCTFSFSVALPSYSLSFFFLYLVLSCSSQICSFWHTLRDESSKHGSNFL